MYTNKIIVNHLNYLIIQDKSNCNFDSYQYYIKNASRTFQFGLRLFWYPQRESNPQLPLRRGPLYPFNYGGIYLRAGNAAPHTQAYNMERYLVKRKKVDFAAEWDYNTSDKRNEVQL